MSDYHGHGTRPDGTHVFFTKAEADALWEACERNAMRDAELIPDTDAALSMMNSVRNRMRKLGWSDAKYCPKDGTEFAAIFPGSSGIFEACYIGDWPHGEIHCLDDSSGVEGAWWKAIDKLTDAERARMAECMAFNLECIEGDAVRFGAMAEADTQ